MYIHVYVLFDKNLNYFLINNKLDEDFKYLYKINFKIIWLNSQQYLYKRIIIN